MIFQIVSILNEVCRTDLVNMNNVVFCSILLILTAN